MVRCLRILPLILLAAIVGCETAATSKTTKIQTPPVVDQSDPIIKVGAEMPPLTFTSIDGRDVYLEKLLKGKKGLVLDFWFVDCPPCREEFPHLQKLYPSLQKNGFALLAVNRLDSRDRTERLLKKLNISFPTALNGKGPNECDKALGISGSPTNIVVDPAGKVVATFEGENERGLLAVLKKLGYSP